MIVTDTPRAASEAPSLTLLERIGGGTEVCHIVDELIARVRRDPHLAARFVELDQARLRTAQAVFFTEAFTGGSPSNARSLIQLDEESFVRVVIHLHDTLESLELSPALTEQLFLSVMSRALWRC
jgi:truncated hemoglobin YjbI